jgi:hypothetical protein
VGRAAFYVSRTSYLVRSRHGLGFPRVNVVLVANYFSQSTICVVSIALATLLHSVVCKQRRTNVIQYLLSVSLVIICAGFSNNDRRLWHYRPGLWFTRVLFSPVHHALRPDV